MNETDKNAQETPEEEKSQARRDYEAGLEFLKNQEQGQAANAFHNALIGFEQEGDELGMANAYDKLGDLCAARRDFNAALEQYERCYAICQKHADRLSLFSIEKKRARLAYEAGNLDQAITLYLEVLDEYTALRNPQGTVDTLDTLAEIYLAQGERGKAADSYRMAATIHRHFKHKRHAEEYMEKAAAVEAG